MTNFSVDRIHSLKRRCCSFVGEGIISHDRMVLETIPLALLTHCPTTHPQTRSDGRGGTGYGIGGRLRCPALSHHFGAAPALRSFRLLPSSVAPLAPLSSPQPTSASLRVSLIINDLNSLELALCIACKHFNGIIKE